MKKLSLWAFIVLAAVLNNSLFAQTITNDFYNVKAVPGDGIRFWGADHYKIHMGNTSEYHLSPTVTDYSIKTNMSNNAHRGWTWGIHGSMPVAALSNTGNFQLNDKILLNGVDGKIGIGTTDPQYNLDVTGTARFLGEFEIRKYEEINYWRFYTEDAKIKSTYIMDINPYGAPYYGPTPALKVRAGYGTAISGIVSNSTYTIGGVEHTGYSGKFIGGQFVIARDEEATTAPDFYVGTDGKIGVGTNTPGAKVDVVGASSGEKLLQIGKDRPWYFTTSSAGAGERIRFVGPNDKYFDIIHYSGRRLASYYASSIATSSKVLFVQDGGTVGVGGDFTPTYKFHVKGDIYADGGWVRVSGTKGIYFQSYGGGFYMIDDSWIRTYNNKNFYHNTGIMRTDGQFHVGSSGNRFIVTQGGNVGIGQTIPQYGKLEINGDGEAEGVTIHKPNVSGGTFRMYIQNQIGYLNRSANETSGISIDTDGNVGVGAEDANYKLDIVGNAITGAEANIFSVSVADAPQDNFSIQNGTTRVGEFTSALIGKRDSYESTAMILSAQSNLSVGDYPLMTFDVRTSLGGTYASTTRPAFSWSNYGQALMEISPSGQVGIGRDPISNATLAVAPTNGDIIAKFYGKGTFDKDRLTIVQPMASNGNVFSIYTLNDDVSGSYGKIKIGHSSTTNALMVDGATGQVGIRGLASDAVLSLGSNSYSQGTGVEYGNAYLRFDNTYDDTGSPSANKICLYKSSTGEFGIGLSSYDFDMFSYQNFRFYTQHTPTQEGINAMTIAGNGQVGIGTDPSVSLDIEGSDAIRIPAGTTAQQPEVGIADAGMIRYNTDDDQLEYYNDENDSWSGIISESSISNNLWLSNDNGIYSNQTLAPTVAIGADLSTAQNSKLYVYSDDGKPLFYGKTENATGTAFSLQAGSGANGMSISAQNAVNYGLSINASGGKLGLQVTADGALTNGATISANSAGGSGLSIFANSANKGLSLNASGCTVGAEFNVSGSGTGISVDASGINTTSGINLTAFGADVGMKVEVNGTEDVGIVSNNQTGIAIAGTFQNTPGTPTLFENKSIGVYGEGNNYIGLLGVDRTGAGAGVVGYTAGGYSWSTNDNVGRPSVAVCGITRSPNSDTSYSGIFEGRFYINSKGSFQHSTPDFFVTQGHVFIGGRGEWRSKTTIYGNGVDEGIAFFKKRTINVRDFRQYLDGSDMYFVRDGDDNTRGYYMDVDGNVNFGQDISVAGTANLQNLIVDNITITGSGGSTGGFGLWEESTNGINNVSGNVGVNMPASSGRSLSVKDDFAVSNGTSDVFSVVSSADAATNPNQITMKNGNMIIYGEGVAFGSKLKSGSDGDRLFCNYLNSTNTYFVRGDDDNTRGYYMDIDGNVNFGRNVSVANGLTVDGDANLANVNLSGNINGGTATFANLTVDNLTLTGSGGGTVGLGGYWVADSYVIESNDINNPGQTIEETVEPGISYQEKNVGIGVSSQDGVRLLIGDTYTLFDDQSNPIGTVDNRIDLCTRDYGISIDNQIGNGISISGPNELISGTSSATSGNALSFSSLGSNGMVINSGLDYTIKAENHSQGTAIWGISIDSEGVLGNSTNDIGVKGTSINSNGVEGYSENNFAVYGETNIAKAIGGKTLSQNGYSGYFTGKFSVFPFNDESLASFSVNQNQILINTTSLSTSYQLGITGNSLFTGYSDFSSAADYTIKTINSGIGKAIWAESTTGSAIYGFAQTSGVGVEGQSASGIGLHGVSATGTAVKGFSDNLNSIAIHGETNLGKAISGTTTTAGNGYAGYFSGNFSVYNFGQEAQAPTLNVNNNQVLINTSVAPDPALYNLVLAVNGNAGVNGTVYCEELKVEPNIPFPDYVFDAEYDLKSIDDVHEFVKENKHLPNIPSAQEVTENGLDVGAMQVKMLEKIEELTLYIIQQNEKLKDQDEKIKKLESVILENK